MKKYVLPDSCVASDWMTFASVSLMIQSKLRYVYKVRKDYLIERNWLATPPFIYELDIWFSVTHLAGAGHSRVGMTSQYGMSWQPRSVMIMWDGKLYFLIVICGSSVLEFQSLHGIMCNSFTSMSDNCLYWMMNSKTKQVNIYVLDLKQSD